MLLETSLPNTIYGLTPNCTNALLFLKGVNSEYGSLRFVPTIKQAEKAVCESEGTIVPVESVEECYNHLLTLGQSMNAFNYKTVDKQCAPMNCGSVFNFIIDEVTAKSGSWYSYLPSHSVPREFQSFLLNEENALITKYACVGIDNETSSEYTVDNVDTIESCIGLATATLANVANYNIVSKQCHIVACSTTLVKDSSIANSDWVAYQKSSWISAQTTPEGFRFVPTQLNAVLSTTCDEAGKIFDTDILECSQSLSAN
eukprot:Awhi_evm1s1647